MIYQLLINHKLFKFIQIGNRTTLVVRSADAVELGAFGRVQPLVRRMVIDLRGVRAAVHARHIAAPAVFILQNAVSAAVRADLQFDIL